MNGTTTNMINITIAIIIHVTYTWQATDAILTRVTLTSNAGDVTASPSVPHLAADSTLRASVRHPSVRLLAAFTVCITTKFIFRSPEISESVNKLPSHQLSESYEGLRVRTGEFVFHECQEVYVICFPLLPPTNATLPRKRRQTGVH